MGHETTARTLIVLAVALATVAAATLGLFALTTGRAPLAADAASFQQADCWNTVWGTDNDGYFFSIIAGDDCPDYRGRVFAGAFQRGPTTRASQGVAKMTGVDACRYDTVEVKAVGVDSEVVLYRFKWTAAQLGCEADVSSTTSTTTGTPGPGQTPTDVRGAYLYSPFPGSRIEVVTFVDGCGLTVTGVGNSVYDVTLNGIQKLTNGTHIAQPFFSFWVGPEGGDRWTASSFHAASLASDCSVQVFRTIEDPAPQPVTEVPPTSGTQPTTPSTSSTTTTSGAGSTTTLAVAGTGATITVDLDGQTILIERCGEESGASLVCIRAASGAWINVDSVDGFGTFKRLEGNTVVYAVAGDELRIHLRTAGSTRPVPLQLFVD